MNNYIYRYIIDGYLIGCCEVILLFQGPSDAAFQQPLEVESRMVRMQRDEDQRPHYRHLVDACGQVVGHRDELIDARVVDVVRGGWCSLCGCGRGGGGGRVFRIVVLADGVDHGAEAVTQSVRDFELQRTHRQPHQGPFRQVAVLQLRADLKSNSITISFNST